MTEEGLYIGIVKDRFKYAHNNQLDRVIILPLMEWDNQEKIWLDINNVQRSRLFPDRGFVIWFNADEHILINQVLKFKVFKNPNYAPNNSFRHAKFSVDRNHFCMLWELLILDFSGSESELRDQIISGKIRYYKPYNTECIIALGKNQWLGVLKFRLNDPLNYLVPTDPENWRNLEIRQIEQSSRIRPEYLDSRIFVDPNQDVGKLISLKDWQPKATFIKRLINRLNEYLEKPQFTSKSSLDLHEFGKFVRKKRVDKAILRRLQEHENMNNLPQDDIDSIVQILMTTEPFHNELEVSKNLILDQFREQARIQAIQEKTGLENKIIELKQKVDEKKDSINQLHIEAEEEIQSKKLEKENLENEIINIKNRFVELEKSLELQRSRTNEMLDEFDDLLNQRLKKFAAKPESMFAEALANDAFLQLIFGKDKRRLELESFSQRHQNMPTFEIQQGLPLNRIENFLTKYHNRLKQIDLDESLAIWTTAIALSGQIVAFEGDAMRRGLMTFANHLTYGRCFELFLSPEIISIERLFTIGQSGNTSNLGILDTAILHAAIHRETLFILVLEGLDRSPSQYFLDTLINWYARGLLDMPGDAFLSNRLEKIWTEHRIWEQHSLADDVLGWPCNLLIVATISGLVDGFSIPTTVQGKIVEVNVKSQGNHLDIHPDLIDQIVRKPASEITVSQWLEWKKKSKDQDISVMSQLIKSHAEKEEFDTVKQETSLRIFAALRTLEKSQDDAVKIIKKYLFES